MNEIRRVDRTDDEIARVREIVAAHPFPEFVTGFDVELGEFDDEPAMWIIFHTTGERPSDPDTRLARADKLRSLIQSVHPDLLWAVGNRYPYYRFDNVTLGPSPSS